MVYVEDIIILYYTSYSKQIIAGFLIYIYKTLYIS